MIELEESLPGQRAVLEEMLRHLEQLPDSQRRQQQTVSAGRPPASALPGSVVLTLW